jgi:hypothetical protein
MNTIDSLITMNDHYRRQRDNLDRIIAENEARIRQAQTLHAPGEAQIGKPGPAVLAVGDVVDVEYRKPAPFWATGVAREFYDVEVAKIEPEYLHITWDDGNEYRTLKRDRLLAVRDPDTLAEVELPAGGSDPSGAGADVARYVADFEDVYG